ncbi:tyrosine-type recombinase/integrase [Sphaerisporangium sp. NPDC005289]|uniref:tyrosine-type recombinase/integrase n=1 Tax=Sphaerisporangium sp. NPDC005289 TaxID=3155247 RepID=UPI0033BB9A40
MTRQRSNAKATRVAVRTHLLRHTAATTLLREGAPRDVVQKLRANHGQMTRKPQFIARSQSQFR